MLKSLGAAVLVATLSVCWTMARADVDGCEVSAAKEVDGQKRLALVVGVGKYKTDQLNTLPGAPADAKRFFRLLIDTYGFPAQNVCLLLNEQATVAAFRSKFDQLLTQRSGPKDVVVIYFAGHGSQQTDKGGDERDDSDETLVFHDSRTGKVGDFVDDEFRSMLLRLHARTNNIVVVLDSCNSSSATRGDETGTLVRYAQPDPEADRRDRETTRGAPNDRKPNLIRENLPGMVILAAAADGTSAFERDGEGVFTKALVETLGGAGGNTITYQQTEKEVRGLVSGRSPQIPTFEGNLDQEVFGSTRRGRPLSLQIDALAADGAKKVGQSVKLSGTPPPGLGKNAVLRVYDAKLPRIRVADPTQAKATIVIDKTSGLSSEGRVIQLGPSKQPLEVGDLAVLIQAADQFVKLPVRIRAGGVPGAVPQARAAAIRKAISDRQQINAIVRIVDDPKEAAVFEVSLGFGDQLQLRDIADKVRIKYPKEEEAVRVAANLWSYGLQRALVQLRGEGGQDYTDNDTIKVSLEQLPSEAPSPCQAGPLEQARPNTKQIVPLCAIYHVKLELSARAPRPLLVGVLMLSSDGKIITVSDSKEPIKPGGSSILPRRLRATTPLNVEDFILAIGTDPSQPIAWQYFSSTDILTEAGVRGGSDPDFVSEFQHANPLSSAIYRYAMPGTRGVEALESKPEDNKPWTRSLVPIEVRANVRFFKPRSDNEPVTAREFTLPKFDVRPYLPDDKSSALYRVLMEADRLTRDRVPYKQHEWKEASDEANVKKGIDCSRAIWYVFKKAGLVYNKSNSFLPTSAMVGPGSPMSNQFESCRAKPYQLGDVLVYRNTSNTVGHTVMVIDPDTTQRIAWGSHGYDSGGSKEGRVPELGAEYQKIMSSNDWKRWDKVDMQLQSCWRYRQFASELKQPGGGPGVQALSKPCEAGYCLVK